MSAGAWRENKNPIEGGDEDIKNGWGFFPTSRVRGWGR